MEDDMQASNRESGDAGGRKFNSNIPFNAGRWTREEHAMFLKGLETYGKEWKRIADLIKTRTVVQIRTHAQKYFQKVAKSTGGPVMSTSKKDDVVRPSNDDDATQKETSDGDDDSKRKRRNIKESSDEDRVDSSSSSTSSKKRSNKKSHTENNNDINDGEKDNNKNNKNNEESQHDKPHSKKPNSIRVPSFHSKPQNDKVSSLRIDSRKGDEGGGVTPRTVAAATILLRPRIQHKLQTGGDTPKTREQAHWLASHQDHAAAVLGKRRRNTNNKNASKKGLMSWETAATNR